MTFELNIPATIAVICVLIIALGVWLESAVLIVPAVLVFFGSTMTYCANTPEAVAARKAEAEAERRAAIPRVIREADGCKVYQFKAAGTMHYFTRCGAEVSTTRNWTEKVKCGKNCTKDVPRQETIVTKEQN